MGYRRGSGPPLRVREFMECGGLPPLLHKAGLLAAQFCPFPASKLAGRKREQSPALHFTPPSATAGNSVRRVDTHPSFG